MYDLLVRGGRIFDPSQGLDLIGDVLVHRGTVLAIAPSLEVHARQVLDSQDMLVIPGLVDLHTHLNLVPGPWGVDPTVLAPSTGVTTWVDAGSAGASALEGLHRASRPLQVQVFALLHASRRGLSAEVGESADLADLDVDAGVAAVAAHPDLVRGIKVRIDRRTVGRNGLEPLRRAVLLARETSRPLMVHVGFGPPSVADILPLLRPGDVMTHCASGTPEDLVQDGRATPAVSDAHERGVHLDLGHGAGSFSFDVLEAILATGIRPLCSTDLNARALAGASCTMPEVITKLLVAGLTLSEVVLAATHRPAEVLDLPAGALRIGARADLALLQLSSCSPRTVRDTAGDTRTTSLRCEAMHTVAEGVVLSPAPAQRARPSIEGCRT